MLSLSFLLMEEKKSFSSPIFTFFVSDVGVPLSYGWNKQNKTQINQSINQLLPDH